MGKLKFRAFRKSDSIMFNNLIGFTIHDNGFISLYLKDSVTGKELEEYYTRADEFVIMQSTGLNDKNGKEIYEGDICIDHGGIPCIGEIKYDEDFAGFFFYLKYEDVPFIEQESIYDFVDIEVIGNIYENPELLEAIKWEK